MVTSLGPRIASAGGRLGAVRALLRPAAAEQEHPDPREAGLAMGGAVILTEHDSNGAAHTSM
jgi:hypothetical protein